MPQEAVICFPLDRRLPRLRLRSRQVHSLVGQRFVLRVDTWPAGSMYPAAHLQRVLGPLNDLGHAPVECRPVSLLICM